MLVIIYIFAFGIVGFIVGGFFADAMDFGERGIGISALGALAGSIVGVAYAAHVAKILEEEDAKDDE